tara:strand:+ start:30836 stop:31165 length:330 start_codon:yes stop_codon:yes gene_type:complete
MRYLKLVILVIVLGNILGCSKEQTTKVINTPTIQCGMCQKNIESGLKSVPGVSKVTVNLDSKTTSVTYDAQKADIKNIENSISKSGYQANNVKADPVTYESLPDCCKIG